MLPALLRLLLACALVATAHAAIPPEELAAARAWFDSLSWLDVRGKPYVEITLVTDRENFYVTGLPVRGFVLAETDRQITVLADGAPGRARPHGGGWSRDQPLSPLTLQKAPSNQFIQYKLGIRRLSLPDAVEETLAAVAKWGELPESARHPFTELKLVPRSALFVLSRFSHQQGRDDLAQRLEETLQTADFETSRKPESKRKEAEPVPTFAQALESEIYRLLSWQLIEDFGRPKVPRAELLAECERLIAGFPTMREEGFATKMAETLRPMVEEDRVHAARARPLAELSEAEQVKELIFQLRDQHGQQMGQPGDCDIFSEGGDTPAHRLVALGFPAVPALIEALGDRRPCRSINFSREYRFSHQVLNIGDCAEAILSRIAGHQFYRPGHIPATASQDGETKPLQDSVRKWWARTEAGGEKAFLISAIARANEDSPGYARRLRQQDPTAAFAALESALRTADSAWKQMRLLEVLGEFTEPAPLGGLRVLMQSSPYLQVRLRAVDLVRQLGGGESTEFLLQQWQAWQPDGKGWGPKMENELLLDALWACGNPGRAALARGLDARSPALRWPALLFLTRVEIGPQLPAQETSPEVLAIIEEACIRALGERTEIHIYGAGEPVSLYNARLCDAALLGLERRWPERYPLPFPDTRAARDVEIAKARNLWRTAHRLAANPVPQRPAHPAAAQDPNVVTAIRWNGMPKPPAIKLTVGQPLRIDDVLETVTALRDQMPNTGQVLRFLAERPADGRGIVVELGWAANESLATFEDAYFDETLIADWQFVRSGGRHTTAKQPPLQEDAVGMEKRRRVFGPGTSGSASWLILGVKPAAK